MAKGPKITTEIIKKIAGVYMDNPSWPAKTIQREVHAQLRKDKPGIPPGWPGLSTIQKILTITRTIDAKRRPESKRLDIPWTMDTLVEYEISPEALPTVLKMAVHFRQKEGEGRRMTIREARWAARLSSLKDLRKLHYYVKDYAKEEKVVELTGTDYLPENYLDYLFYRDLTNKSFNEPVFDKYGREILRNSPADILDELEELHKRRMAEINKREADNERSRSAKR